MIANPKPLLIIMALLLGFCIFPTAEAFTYTYGENLTIYPRCVNATSGAFYGVNANLTIRNETGIFYQVDTLPTHGPGLFSHNITNLSENHCYALDLGCEDTGSWQNEWATLCVQDKEVDKMVLAVIILLPMLLAFLLILAAFSLSEDHWVLKVFMLLLSPIAFFSSLHFGLVSIIKYFDFPEMQELLGSTSYWIGWVLFVLTSYFVLYIIYNIFKAKREKKKDREEY